MPLVIKQPWLRRLAGALPDAITGIACWSVWVWPFTLGPNAVKTVVLMMLMEFGLVHATGFFTAATLVGEFKRWQRLLMIFGLCLFYALLLGSLAWAFRAWWPLWAFAWLAAGKATWIFASPRDRDDEMFRQMGAWAFSVAMYLGVVFAGLLLPVPVLGITPAVVATLDLPGSGAWIDRTHAAVAGLGFYYLALAGFKYWWGDVGAARFGAARA